MKYVQAKLTKNNLVIISWIEKKKKVKIGCLVELKEDDNNLWKVEELYTEIEKDELNKKKTFDKSFGSSIK